MELPAIPFLDIHVSKTLHPARGVCMFVFIPDLVTRGVNGISLNIYQQTKKM